MILFFIHYINLTIRIVDIMFKWNIIICSNKKDEDELLKIIKNAKMLSNFDEYEKQRILNCVPDIEKDNLYNKAYLLQYNFDNLNSICWKKGCFVGQEVTIKMKNKGFLKKKLYVIKSFTKKLNSPEEIKYKNRNYKFIK